MHKNRFPRWLLAGFVLVIFIVLAGWAWFYHAQEQHVRQEVEENLQAIAELKASQIVQWRGERVGDTAVMMKSPLFIQGIRRWMAAPQAEDSDTILSRLRALQEYCHYRDVLLVDAGGKVRLSLTNYHGPLDEEAAVLSAAVRERRPVLTDLHVGPGDLPPHMDVIAPLFADSGEAAELVAVVVMQIDARQFLV